MLDEKIICEEYQTQNIGIEALGKKYHVGKIKIKNILQKNNIPIKKKGGQLEAGFIRQYIEDKEKYKPTTEYYWVVIDCKNEQFISDDVYNRSGALTTYIKKTYDINIPTLFYRKKYYQQEGKYWWEQWLEYKKIEVLKKPIVNGDDKLYVNTEAKKWVVYDKNNPQFVSEDIYNLGGYLSSYLRRHYNIKAPSFYQAKKFIKSKGQYWWEQWLSYRQEDINIKETPKQVDDNICELYKSGKTINQTASICNVAYKTVKRTLARRGICVATKRCPYCEWETSDIDNKSGSFEMHLLKYHNMTKQEYLKEHLEDKNYFIVADTRTNLEIEEDESKYVTCEVCGKRFKQLTNAHLASHNLTKYEYDIKYRPKSFASQDWLERAKERGRELFLYMEDKETKFTSKAESEIKGFIEEMGYETTKSHNILKHGEIDIFIPKLNIAIEYNGLRWHTEEFGGKDRNYHLNKTLECNENGINLIQIFEDEYVTKRDIVYSKIKHLIGCDENLLNIYGRKCIIKEVGKGDAQRFLERYHIQGYGNSSVNFGAYCNDELVAVMSFRRNDDRLWELVRFATNSSYRYSGVASKIFNHFTKTYRGEIGEVKSFADVRWTLDKNNNLYTKLGFKLDCVTKPDYTYYNQKYGRYIRFHKFGFRKQILNKKYGLPLSMTENEMTKTLGFDKIWNCGLFKYIWKPNE